MFLSSSTPLAVWELQSEIREALSYRLTGEIRITFLNDWTETIFVHSGQVCHVHIRNHRLPDLNWELPLTRYGRGMLEINPMPARALMFRKIMVEEITSPAPQQTATNQLKAMFDFAERNEGASLFHIQWKRAEGFVLSAGRYVPIRHAVLLTQAGVEEGPVALDQILAQGEAQCRVTTYRGDIKNQAWLEVHLNLLFEWYCAMILNHYGQLTGAVMMQSIVRKIHVLASEASWDIKSQKTEVRDTSLFPHAAGAGEAYKKILSAIISQMEPVIGSTLTQRMLKQAGDSTRGIYQIIEEVFGLIGESSI